MAVMICLLLCQSMNTFTEVVERTQIETGGREIRSWWGRVNTSAAIESQQLWMRLLHETLNASVARHKALLFFISWAGDGDNRKASPGHNSLTVNSVHLFT